MSDVVIFKFDVEEEEFPDNSAESSKQMETGREFLKDEGPADHFVKVQCSEERPEKFSFSGPKQEKVKSESGNDVNVEAVIDDSKNSIFTSPLSLPNEPTGILKKLFVHNLFCYRVYVSIRFQCRMLLFSNSMKRRNFRAIRLEFQVRWGVRIQNVGQPTGRQMLRFRK